MTRDEILNLRANPETNALVAENVMGWRWIKLDDPKSKMLIPPEGDKRITWCAEWDEEGRPHWLPNYSADISSAWEVVEKLSHCRLRDYGYWECEFMGVEARADTAPLAICRAALLEVMDL